MCLMHYVSTVHRSIAHTLNIVHDIQGTINTVIERIAICMLHGIFLLVVRNIIHACCLMPFGVHLLCFPSFFVNISTDNSIKGSSSSILKKSVSSPNWIFDQEEWPTANRHSLCGEQLFSDFSQVFLLELTSISSVGSPSEAITIISDRSMHLPHFP